MSKHVRKENISEKTETNLEEMTEERARAIQSAVDKNDGDQSFKSRAMKAAHRNKQKNN